MAERGERVLDNPDTFYERQDLRLMVIGVIALVLFAVLIVVPLVLRGAYPETMADVDRKQRVLPPAPMLQTDPRAEFEGFRAEEEARLNSYGWVDRQKDIVHIPIAQAMKEVAQQGLPDFPKAKP